MRKLITEIIIFIYLFSDDGSDETESESGSGSGSGIDDEDDSEDGSGNRLQTFKNKLFINSNKIQLGLNGYPDQEPPITPPHSPHIPIDTSSGTRHNVHEINKNTIDESSSSGDLDISEESDEPKTSSSTSSWKTKRLIITYFLPIVMAWFGGSISSAISELL